MDSLSLFRGKSLEIGNGINIRHPKLSDIEELGYENYQKYTSILLSTSLDIADILWVEKGIWYEDIKNEWDFFIQKSFSFENKITVKFIYEENKILKIEKDCIAVGVDYANALNYFLGLNGTYIAISSNQNDIQQTFLYNVIKDKDDTYILAVDNFKITEHIYQTMFDYLKKINWFKQKYEVLTAGNKRTKKYILKNEYSQRKWDAKTTPKFTLESIASSLIANGMDYEKIWNLPIYTVYELYYRTVKIGDYKNTITALYSGCIDTKKNPINWEKINWATVIN